VDGLEQSERGLSSHFKASPLRLEGAMAALVLANARQADACLHGPKVVEFNNRF
jgi:hypothetical protein